jgi:hypothetical protein
MGENHRAFERGVLPAAFNLGNIGLLHSGTRFDSPWVSPALVRTRRKTSPKSACIVSIVRNHSAWAAGGLSLIGPVLEDRGVLLVHLDEVREGLDAEVRECHHTVVAVPVDPDDAVFGVHLVGDIMEPVHILAEFPGDTINRFDGMNLVDVQDQAAWAGLSDERRCEFHGNSSSSRCMG